MIRFWFALTVLLLMCAYQGIVTLLAAHVVGVEIPPTLTLALLSVSPVILLLANGLPGLYSLLPGATGQVPIPLATASAATIELATHTLQESAATETAALTPAPEPAPETPPASGS
jgi:hypothetical protein